MKQSEALDILKMGKNVFLTGSAGSGKTHILRAYIDYLRDADIEVAVTASTGIAATHMSGQTIHSWSGIGIRDTLTEWEVDAMLEKKYLYKRFKDVQVLIIDEISMLSKSLLDNVDQVLQAFKRSTEPFGGIQVVMSGDFFQLPPIVRDDEPTHHFSYHAHSWKQMDVHVCYLHEQHRQDDTGLLDILNAIRAGAVSQDHFDTLTEQSEIALSGITPTRLYTHNADVDTINTKQLDTIDDSMHVYDMITMGQKKYIDILKKTILAPEKLQVKVGASVMFVKNNFAAGYVNGTLGTVVDIDGDVPVVQIINGQEIDVVPESWMMENDNGKVLAEVRQLPLRLAWAITIHKSQGMTLDAAEIDLSRCFVPGQGYVALSRVRSLDGLLVRGMNQTALSVHPHVQQMDQHFLEKSAQLSRRLDMTAAEKLSELHAEFVVIAGGELDIEKRAEKKKKRKEAKKSTLEKTHDLIKKEKSIPDMMTDRGVQQGTIISHIEKLRAAGQIDLGDIDYLKPQTKEFEKDLEIIADAVRQARTASDDGSAKLSAVRSITGSTYSYDDIRFMRLFC